MEEKIQIVTNAEFDAVLNSTVNPKHKLQLLLLHDAGLRATECCEVLWEKCDFRKRKLTVFSGKQRKAAPGEAPKKLKTRTIPMSNRLYAAFVVYAEKEGKREGFLFSGKGGKPPGRSSLNTLLKRLEAKTPEVERLYPHKMRHSFATDLIGNGAELLEVGGLLGHGDPKTTVMYNHLNQAKIRAMMDAPLANSRRSLISRFLKIFHTRETRPLSIVVADPTILVGRFSEVRTIETAIRKEISVILTGTIGVGKSHILQNLKHNKPVLEIDSCASFKKSIAAGILHISETKEVATEMLYGTSEPGALSVKLSKESLINLCETLCKITLKKEYILQIGHVDDITPSVVRALERLREHFVIITTARKIAPLLSSWIWDFDRVQINPLSREDSLRLFIRLTSELQISSPEYVKNKVHETAEGNPRVVIELAERFGKELLITPEIVDEITANYIGRQVKEIDMSLMLLLCLGGFAVLRYVGKETNDSSLQMIGGCIMIVLLFARYFFNSTKRISL